VAYKPLGHWLVRRSDAVIAVSEAEAQLLDRDFPNVRARLSVVHNGVDLAAIERSEPFAADVPTILVAGRIEPYKRVEVVIEAFARVLSPSRLVILGDGSGAAAAKQLVAKSPRSADIDMRGHVGEAELRRWQRTARCVVNFSEHEAFGLSALEGGAAGANVVLSDIPAHREVAELLPPGTVTLCGDTRGLTDAMSACLDEPTNGTRTVRSWDDVTDDLLRTYRAVALAA
jgi:glycosyltransferase involved in cell wall biosynthesis